LPEVEAIVRQLISVHVLHSKPEKIDLVRHEFVSLFAAHFLLKRSQAVSRAEGLFDFLAASIESVLDEAIGIGILSAHEAKSTLRHQQLFDQIAAIQKNLDFLRSRPNLDVPAILQFEEKYRTLIGERHGKITPPEL
jgi:hypothetical protein